MTIIIYLIVLTVYNLLRYMELKEYTYIYTLKQYFNLSGTISVNILVVFSLALLHLALLTTKLT